MNKIRSVYFVIFLFLLITFYSSCNDDKVNGKYTILVDGGMKRLIGGNVVSDRKDVYPNIIDIEYDKYFVLIEQVPDREKYAMYLSSNLYNLYCAYSNYLKDSVANKKWGGLESDSVIYDIFRSRGASTENTSKDIQIRLNVADSLVSHDPNYQKIFTNDTNYWIIDEAKDTLIGPLAKSEYLIQRNELKIPDDLKLD